jgi:hypothetical protein
MELFAFGPPPVLRSEKGREREREREREKKIERNREREQSRLPAVKYLHSQIDLTNRTKDQKEREK